MNKHDAICELIDQVPGLEDELVSSKPVEESPGEKYDYISTSGLKYIYNEVVQGEAMACYEWSRQETAGHIAFEIEFDSGDLLQNDDKHLRAEFITAIANYVGWLNDE